MAVVVDTRTLEHPVELIPWTTVYSEVRAATGQYTSSYLADIPVQEATKRAIQRCWPYTFQQEFWSCTIASYTDGVVTLPAIPHRVLEVIWKSNSDTGSGKGLPLTPALWQRTGLSWRWLGSSAQWPSGSIAWGMRVVMRPQSPSAHSTGCTAPLQYVVPLAVAELMPQILADQRTPQAEALRLGTEYLQSVLGTLPFDQNEYYSAAPPAPPQGRS